jgi:hypothetical protein
MGYSSEMKNRRHVLNALALGTATVATGNWLFPSAAEAASPLAPTMDIMELPAVRNDTPDILSALAHRPPVHVPFGTFLLDKPIEYIRARLYGQGQIRAIDGRTAPYYSVIDEQPGRGDNNTIRSAFDGDISAVSFAIGHVIAGNDTLGHATDQSEDVLRVYTPEAYPTFTFLQNDSGSRDLGGKTDMRGATMAAAHLTDVRHLGRGDASAYVARTQVSGQNPDSEHVINNAWGMGFVSEIRAKADGVFLLPVESAYTDSGFDVGSVGHLLLGRRTNDTGAKYANWIGYVAKSVGGDKPWDVFYTAYGHAKIGIDFTQAYFESTGFDGAAMVLAGGQRIYFDGQVDLNIPADCRWKSEDPGDVWLGYDKTNSSITMNNGSNTAFSLQKDGLTIHGNVGFFGSRPKDQPTLSGSRSNFESILSSIIGALVDLNLVKDLTVE